MWRSTRFLRRQWPWLLAAAMALLAVAVLTVPWPDPVWQERYVYDFGRVGAGSTVKHDFVLSNPFGRALKVLNIQTGCACTTVGEAPKELPARSSVALPLAVEVGYREQQFQKNVTVQVEDLPPIVLLIRGQVILTHPASVKFGSFLRGQSPVKEIAIRAVDEVPVSIKDAKYDSSLLNVKLPDKAGGEVTQLAVSVSPKVPSGPFSTVLRVVTDDQEQPERVIKVQGYVLRDVEVEPRVLNFGIVNGNQSPVMQLQVQCPYGQPLQLKSITVEPVDMARVAAKPAEKRNDLILADVQLSPSLAVGLQKGSLVVKTEIGGVAYESWIDFYALKR